MFCRDIMLDNPQGRLCDLHVIDFPHQRSSEFAKLRKRKLDDSETDGWRSQLNSGQNSQIWPQAPEPPFKRVRMSTSFCDGSDLVEEADARSSFTDAMEIDTCEQERSISACENDYFVVAF